MKKVIKIFLYLILAGVSFLLVHTIVTMPRNSSGNQTDIGHAKNTPLAIPAGALPEKSLPKDDEKPLLVDVRDLIRAYEFNEASADTTYQWKMLQITGFTYAYGKDGVGNMRIAISTIPAVVATHALPFIWCWFDKSEESSLSGVVGSQIITVSGACEGLYESRPVLFGCHLISSRPVTQEDEDEARSRIDNG